MTQNKNKAASDVSAALAPLSRRSVLKTGLWAVAGASALAAGGFALLRPSPRDSLPVPAGLVHLQAQHYHLFSRLTEILLPTEGTALLPAAQVPVVNHIDGLLDALDPAIRKQLLTGLALFDNAAVVTHFKRFVDLPDADALAYVGDWVNSGVMPKRALGFVVTKLTHTGYWMDSQTWPMVEFDGPVSRRWGIPSRGNQPLPG